MRNYLHSRIGAAIGVTVSLLGFVWLTQPNTAVADIAESDDIELQENRVVAGRFVTPDGQQTTVRRLTNQLGVVLHPEADAEICAQRLAAQGRGVLRDVDLSPRARVKILEIQEAASVARTRALEDPDIIEVRPVYLFDGHTVPAISSGTIVIRLQPEIDEQARDAMFAEYDVQIVEPFEGLANTYIIELSDGSDEAEIEVAEALALDDRSIWAQPNLRRPKVALQIAPQDQYFNVQWHLNNTGQVGGVADADIDALQAWEIAEGADILFGIFDDAVDVNHPDLVLNWNGEGNDPSIAPGQPGSTDPTPKDFLDRHGTAVLGLAVAQSNTFGVRGVSYLSRFTASRGLTELLTDAQLASVYTFALQQQVDVHINSWGPADVGPISAVIADNINRAFLEGRDFGDDGIKGMVIVFAAGNENEQISTATDYAALPSVIGVAASNVNDVRASYSDWGPNIDIMAPSGDDFVAGMVTTDIEDDAGYPELGYNQGGVEVEIGIPDLDPNGDYTQFFSGTSAACPVAAGVAGLILSRNPLLTATDVKLILQHTTDFINPEGASYNGVTSRSVQYGYGRINARTAVEAASNSLTNGGKTWPARAINVAIDNGEIVYTQSTGTDEYLVVESDDPFAFIPEDGKCYSSNSLVCQNATIDAMPAGVSILDVGCGADRGESCDSGSTHRVPFLLPSGTKYFGVYARSSIGRYSFGVSIDSNGNVLDSGPTIPGMGDGGGGGGGGGGGDDNTFLSPQVTAFASPLSGNTPLTVSFDGNAIGTLAIDSSMTSWDFDFVGDNDECPSSTHDVDSTSRNTTHTYVVESGTVRTFKARLQMFDTDGNCGSDTIQISVDGGNVTTVPDGSSALKILVGTGTTGSDVSQGVSPFTANLSLDGTALTNSTLQSVSWDLGDGSTASSLSVMHTYVNNTEFALDIPISAEVTTVNAAGVTETRKVSRSFKLLPPSGDGGNTGDPGLPGTGASGPGGSVNMCGMGMMLVLLTALGMGLVRRRLI